MEENTKKVLGTLAIAGVAVGGFVLYKKGKKLFPARKMNFALLGFRIHSIKPPEVQFAVKLRCYNPTKEPIQLSIAHLTANHNGSPLAFSKPNLEALEIKEGTYQEPEIIFQVPYMNLVGKGLISSLNDQTQFQKKLSFTLTIAINGETITTTQKLTDDTMSGLGIVSGPRNTKNGSQFNHLIRPAQGMEILLKNGNVHETVQSCMDVVARHYREVAPLAQKLKAGELKQTCANIFNFAYNYLQYKLDDPGTEQLRTPARSWHDGQVRFMQQGDKSAGIDCDDFSIFCGSLLKCLGIPFKFRITKYDGKRNFQHIYVFVPAPGDSEDEIIIDPVLSQFDYQKPYSFEKSNFDMTQIELAGTGKVLNGASALGLPISVLSGIDLNGTVVKDNEFHDLMGIVSGVDFQESMNGLGSTEDATLKYLVRTRDFLLRNKANRERMGHIQNPEQFINMLDQAIRYWNTPHREKVLDKLADMEERLAEQGFVKYDIDAIQGVDEFDALEEELEGLEGRGRRRARRAARRKRMARFFKAVKVAGKKVIKAHVNVAKKVAKVAKKAAKAVVRFNPLSIAIRAGLLAAFRLNIGGMAKNLQYAYLPDNLALKHNIDPQKHRELKTVHEKVKKLFKGLQGKEENLKKVILQGAKQRSSEFSLQGSDNILTELQKLETVGGLAELGDLGEPATAASIAAAGGVIATIKKWLSPVKDIFKKRAQKKLERRQKQGKPISEKLRQRAQPSATVPTPSEPDPEFDTDTPPFVQDGQDTNNYQGQYNMPMTIDPAMPDQKTAQIPKPGLSKKAKIVMACGGAIILGTGLYLVLQNNEEKKEAQKKPPKNKKSLGAITLK